jgi:hypothetical protein
MPNKHNPEKKCLTLWVHKDFEKWLKSEAKKRGTSKSELIRLACRKWYEKGAKDE